MINYANIYINRYRNEGLKGREKKKQSEINESGHTLEETFYSFSDLTRRVIERNIIKSSKIEFFMCLFFNR